MTANQIYEQAKRYQRTPESPDKWRAYTELRRQLEIIVPSADITKATRKLTSIMKL